MNNKNSNGPSTPLTTGILSEVVPSTILTLAGFCRLEKHESIFGLLLLCHSALFHHRSLVGHAIKGFGKVADDQVMLVFVV